MKALRSPLVTVALVLTACATGVTDDLPNDEGGGAGGTSQGGTPGTAGNTSSGSGGTLGMAGSLPTNAFGGTGSTAGKGGGGASSAGSAGKASGGSAGASAGGSGGKATGGGAGAAGTSGSGGSGGSVVVGTGSCAGTMAFTAGTKYATAAKVVATCSGGTPCLKADPPGMSGKMYEFSCLDQYNCGGQDPGTTNWSQPPWQLTKACTP